MTTPSYTQVAFRYRNDNGNETEATWRQTQGTNDTLSVDTNYRMRFLIDETNNKNWANVVWSVWCSKNGGSYAQIGSGQPVNYSLSSYFANNDNTTSQLTGGSGSFLSSNSGMQESSTSTNTGAANNYFEIELCFQIDSAQVANGDTLALRVYSDGSPLTSYTATPSITVSEVASVAVNKSESVTVGESKSVVLADLAASKSDSVTVGESRTLHGPANPNKSDSVAVGESASARPEIYANKSESVSIGESVAWEVTTDVPDPVNIEETTQTISLAEALFGDIGINAPGRTYVEIVRD